MRRRVPLVLLVLASLTLITLDVGTPLLRPYTQAARTAAAAVVTPMQQQARGLTGADQRSEEVARLRAANARLTAQNGLLRAAGSAAPNPEVRRAVGDDELIPARVVAPGPAGADGLGHTVPLDVGSDDGVRVGAGVIAPDGVVGRVLRTGTETSTVLLLTDPRCTIGVRHVDSGRLGLLEGDGASAALRMLATDTTVRPGDRLVTWGSARDRPYPPGIPVGRVGRVDRESDSERVARVRPATDPAGLDRVVVLR